MSDRNIPSKERFADRFAKMWHDLIGSPLQHTKRYAYSQGLMEEADARIDRLRAALIEAREYILDNGADQTMAPVIQRIDDASAGLPVETTAPLPEGFTLYKRVGSILARPWTQQDAADYLNGIHTNVSVSDADKHTACVAQGMLAMNPANSYDCWYIAPTYFAKHYASDSPVKSVCEPSVPPASPTEQASLNPSSSAGGAVPGDKP